MYVLSWRTLFALTWVLFWCLFLELLRNSGNKHKNNPLVSAETVRHSTTYIILNLVEWVHGQSDTGVKTPWRDGIKFTYFHST